MRGQSGVAPELLTALPKGGAAATALADVFTPRLATGSIAYRLSLVAPRGRVDGEVDLALEYDQLGGGASAFGLGWSVPLPAVRRRTNRGVPRYDDTDAFALSTGEELLPVGGGRFATRVESFRRILRQGGGWEITDKDGTRYLLGHDPGSRLADPDDPSRVFEWLLSRRVDTNGNLVEYRWRHDDSWPRGPQGRPGGAVYPHEIRWCHANDGHPLCVARFDYEFAEPGTERSDASTSWITGFPVRTSWRCRRIVTFCADLAEVGAGSIDLGGAAAGQADSAAFLRQGALVAPASSGPLVHERWAGGEAGTAAAGYGPLRVDLPVALAEVTARLHLGAAGRYTLTLELADGTSRAVTVDAAGPGSRSVPLVDASGRLDSLTLDGGGRPYLLERLEYGAGNARPVVASRYDLVYHPTATETTALDLAAVAPNISLLASVTRVGYDDAGGEDLLPPVRFDYTRLNLVGLWPDQLPGSPREPLSEPNTTLISFMGNARVDVLQTSAGHRCYLNGGRSGAAVALVGRDLDQSPPVALDEAGTRLRDVNGRGSVDLSTDEFYYHNPATSPTPIDPDQLTWGDFQQFSQTAPHPQLGPAERPVTRAIDLNGDGNIDLLQTGREFVAWRNRGDGSWSPPERQPRRHSFGARAWPDIAFDDAGIAIADMNGDGLDEIVRVSGRKVEYWSHADGRFGFKTTMLGSPRLRGFNPRRALVVDLTNDGFADLVYVGSGRVSVWLNQGGRRFTRELVIDLSDPAVSRGVRIPADADALEAVDLAGDGMRGLLWSFERVSTEGNYYFMPLTRGPKPGLLRSIDNGLGGVIEVDWTTSAIEAAEAEARGEPWSSHAPFPVSVVKRIRKHDRVSGTMEVCELDYCNGYHDRADRRFLGFGRVTETFFADPAGAGTRIVHDFANRDVLHLQGAELARARTLSGRELRLQRFDLVSGALLEETHTVWTAVPVHGWAMSNGGATPAGVLNPADPLLQPHLVAATHELTVSWEGAAQPRYRLIERRYEDPGHPGVPDEFGNLREEIDHGEVATQGAAPPLLTLEVDGRQLSVHDVADAAGRLVRHRYVVNRAEYIVSHPSVTEEWAGPGFTVLTGETRSYYDGGINRDDYLPLGQVLQGNLQRRERLAVAEQTVTDRFEPGFLGRLGNDPDEGPGHFQRAVAGDGRPSLFVVELRRRFFHAGARIRYGQVRSQVEPRGGESVLGYDAEGWMPATYINPEQQLTRVRRYNYRSGKPQELEDPNGTVSRNQFDHFGRVTATWADTSAGAAADVEWSYAFDVARQGPGTVTPVMIEQRQLIDRRDAQPRQIVTRAWHDGFGKELQRRRSAAGAAYTVDARAYSSRQLLVREWLPWRDPSGDYAVPGAGRPARSHRYDALGRLVETGWPDGTTSRVERAPWTTRELDREDTDPGSAASVTPRVLEHDAAGRVVRIRERIVYPPDGQEDAVETSFRFDPGGRVIERRDPDGLVTTQLWTADGRLLWRRHPDAGERWTCHDAAGNRIYERDARGNVVWTRYDRLNRVVAEIPVDDLAGQPDIDYVYDDAATLGIGRLRSVDDRTGNDRVAFEYDRRANVSRMTRQTPGGQYEFTMSYNALGLLTTRTYPSGDTLDQTYGVDGRVATMTHTLAATGASLTTVSGVTYHPDGQVEEIAFMGGALTTVRAYDPQTHWLTSIASRDAAGAVVQSLLYADRDNVGNLRELRDETDPAAVMTETFWYDSLYRLRRARLQSAGLAGYDFGYRYHGNGRMRRNDELDPNADYAYDLASHPNAPRGTTTNPAAYDYDATGNLLGTPGQRSLRWNVRNQLERVEYGGVRETYRYAYDETRINRELRRPGQPTSVTEYPDHDYEVRDGTPVVAVTLGEVRLAEIDPAGTALIFLLDHLMSVRGAADAGGAPVAGLAERFRPYGGTHLAPAQATKNRRFSGRERDDSGLYWFGGRYYDPELAAWASVDPTGQFHSPYVYADGNPINLLDLDGADAVAIVFPDFKIAAMGTKLGYLGHAGVLLIDNKTGLTKYYEYGRYDAAERGLVRTRTVPDVKIKDGRPTRESLERVLRAVGRESGQRSRIEGAYVRTDKFKEMNQYAQDRLKLNRNPNREEYAILSNNCGTFMASTIEAGDVDLPAVVDPRPVSIAEEIRDEHQTVDFSPKRGLRLGPPVEPQPAREKVDVKR